MYDDRRFFHIDGWFYLSAVLAIIGATLFNLWGMIYPFVETSSMSEWAVSHLPILMQQPLWLQTLLIGIAMFLLMLGAVYVIQNRDAYGDTPTFGRLWVMAQAALFCWLQYINLYSAPALEFYMLTLGIAQIMTLVLVFCERDRSLTYGERIKLILLAGASNSLANGLVLATLMDGSYLLTTISIGLVLSATVAWCYTGLYFLSWVTYKATGISLIIKSPRA